MVAVAILSIDTARQVVLDAIEKRTFPGAVVDVGSSDGSLWRDAFGARTFARAAPTIAATPFDLASLTKVIATTTVIMDLVATGVLRLDQRIAENFDEWRGHDREAVTILDLLEHTSGLPARLLDAPPATWREFEHDITTMPLAYVPRMQSIYSDLGFLLLGKLAETFGRHSLDQQFGAIVDRLSVADTGLQSAALTYKLSATDKALAAPTRPEDDDLRRGRELVGEVHDNYAARLGGVAGHAGLFGTAAAVGGFARLVLRAARSDAAPAPLSPLWIARFITKSTVAGSSRALGWDTMLPTSSCGTRMSATAFGHVGFTGTSLWIDPQRDRYFVLLTNRAYQGGTLAEMRIVRRSFHDELAGL